MTKIAAVLLIVGAVFVVACNYQAPPGGAGSYCWRIKQARNESNDFTLALYTNAEPERRGSQVTVENAWSIFPLPDEITSGRYVEEVVLNEVLGHITIEQRCEPSNE